MDNKKDLMEQIIKEDLLAEAESIDKEYAAAGSPAMPADIKAKIKANLDKQIAEMNREHAYSQLSDEDREALELGRQLLKEKASEETKVSEKTVVYRKRPKKVYVAVAAVAVLVLALGVTSMGGAERIAEMIGIKVGTREVVQVNTDEDNYIVTSDNEEEAYQELKDLFGVETVKIVHWPDGAKFLSSEIDVDLQNAVLIYEYNGELMNYFINSHYTQSSWGMDIEDTIVDRYYIEHQKKGNIEITEYEVNGSKINRFSARYEHSGLEYFLIGTMEKEEFENLIKNLIFF